LPQVILYENSFFEYFSKLVRALPESNSIH